jgi:hypothetical protein
MKKALTFILLACPSISLANSYECTTDGIKNPLGTRTVKVEYNRGSLSGSFIDVTFTPSGSKYEQKLLGDWFWKERISERGNDVFSDFRNCVGGHFSITIVTDTHLDHSKMTYFDLYTGGFYWLDLEAEQKYRFVCKSLD